MTNYPDEDVISSKVHWSEAHGVRATACICQFNPDHSHLFINLAHLANNAKWAFFWYMPASNYHQTLIVNARHKRHSVKKRVSSLFARGN